MGSRFREKPGVEGAASVEFKSARAQRLAASVIGQTVDVQEDSAREAERAAKEQAKAQEDTAKAQTEAAEAARAMSVRAGAAAGMKTETDIATGKRSIATHPDGAPVFKAKPLGDPIKVGTQSTAINVPGETQPTTRPFLNPLMAPTDGATGATGGTTKSIFAQPVRDDRGNVSMVQPDTTTDAKTGRQYTSKTDPMTGATVKTAVGIDQPAYDKIQRDQQYEAKARELALRDNNVKQARMRFEPAFKPVADEFKAAKTELEALPPVFVKEGGIWRYTDPKTLKVVTTYDPADVERNKALRAKTEERFSRAQQAFQKMEPTAANLDRNEKEIEAAKLKLSADKLRIDAGLPEDDGGAAELLAGEASGAIPPAAAKVAETTATLEPMGPPRPILTAESDEQAVRSAYGALRGIEGITARKEVFQSQADGKEGTLTVLERDGKRIATVSDGDFAPTITLTREGREDAEIRGIANLGTTGGAPLYLQRGKNRKPITQEAAEVAGIFTAVKDPLLYDEQGKPLPALSARLEELQATPQAIMRRVDSGDLSVQHGAAILKDLYGTTMEATDPNDPEVFKAWVAEKTQAADQRLRDLYGKPTLTDSKSPGKRLQDAGGAIKDFGAMDQVKRDFLVDQYRQNAGKPGVKHSDYVRMHMETNAKAGAPAAQIVGSWLGSIGNLVKNDVAGSMVGLATGLSVQGGAGMIAWTGDAEAKAKADEFMRLRNRSFANFTDGFARNVVKWGTPTGRQAMGNFDKALADFQQTIDAELDKPMAERDQTRIQAAKQGMAKAAKALHDIAPDEKWPMAEQDFDPDKDPVLMEALARYAATADPRVMGEFKARLLMNNGGRQLAAEMAKKVRNDGFWGAVEGGTYAGWQEIGTELLADAGMLLTAGGSKAIQGALKTAGAVGKAKRIERTGKAIGEILEKWETVGIRPDSLAAPLTGMQKAGNTATQIGKTLIQAGAGEGMEEVIVEMGADDPDLVHAALVGALGGVALTPAFYPVQRAIRAGQERTEAITLEKRNAAFAKRYNDSMSGVEGFTPITTETAATARNFIDARGFEARTREVAKVMADINRMGESTPEAKAVKEQLAETYRSLSAQLTTESKVETEKAIAAAQEIDAITDPARKIFMRGVAKVIGGNVNILTQAERSALQRATTEAGAPYFATVNGMDYVTDEGRAEIAMNAPAVGALIQTTESQALVEAQAAAPEPFTPPVDASGAQGDPATGGVVPPHVSAASGEGVQFASMEAAEYESARAENPDMPEILETVVAAVAQRLPISVSMMKAAGIEIPDGYTREGATWKPAVSSNTGPAENQATTGKTPENTPDKAKDGTAKENTPQAIAARIQATVETSIPGMRGRISIVKSSGFGITGGALADSAGIVRLPLDDIARTIKGRDPTAVEQSIIDTVIRHEVVHIVQYEALRKIWDGEGSFDTFFSEFYGRMAGELHPDAFTVARGIYGEAAWDAIPTDAQKAAELVRMLVEARLNPEQAERFSELSRAINLQMPASFIELMKAAVETLVEMIQTGKLPESARVHVDAVAAMYQELVTGNNGQNNGQAPAPNPAESQQPQGKEVVTTPDTTTTTTSQPTGLRIVLNGDKASIMDGDATLEIVPADQADAALAKYQAAMDSPDRIAGEAIKAALDKFPRLAGKLRKEIEDAAELIIEELADERPENRMAFAEKAIASRINFIADREAERTGKKREEVIESFRAVAGKQSAKQAASIEAAVIGSEAPAIPLGRQEQRDTPNSEMTVDVTSTFVDLDQLVGSSDPLFPGGALQPRNRATQASRNQREEMVQNIRDKEDQHRRYIEGATTDSGRMVIAPLFGADGQHMTNEAVKPLFYVISGNGRRNALAEAHARKVSGKIEKGFRDAAASEGIDTEGMGLPVPVSVFVPSSAKEAIDLAEYSNRDAQLSVSNTEQANRDAASIEKANLLPLWEPDASGDAAAASNRGFVKAFARAVGDEGIIDGRGELTEEGAKRIERAMVAMLLPDQAALLDMLFNRSGTLGLRAMIGGVASEAGSLLKLAAVKPDFDLSPVLATALRAAVEAKQSLAGGEIRDVGEWFDQGNLFESSEMTPDRQLARALVESRSRKAIIEILGAYRRGAEAVDTSTMSMFAEEETSREDVILKALEARPIEQVVAEVEAEFGAKADLPAKLRIVIPAIRKLPLQQRKAMNAAIGAEVERLRDGVVSAPEWQRLNPDALSPMEAMFQRVLDSHTPQTLPAGMGKMLSKSGQAALASSPAPIDPNTPIEVVDTQTGEVVWKGTYAQRETARRVQDRRDNKYGGYRFRVQKSPITLGSSPAPDPRLVEAFGENFEADEYGMPVTPRTLPDGHPLLTDTEGKTTAYMTADHPLVAGLSPEDDLAEGLPADHRVFRGGFLPAGEVSRKQLRRAIVAFFMSMGTRVQPGQTPVAYATGGGGGAGKSTILKILRRNGDIDTTGAVPVNSDEIKRFLPEWPALLQAGEGRAAAIVHNESSMLTESLLDAIMDTRDRSFIFDATLANTAKSLAKFTRWKKTGYQVQLIGVTIEPIEAVTRAILRGKQSGRWVPTFELFKAHAGFNRGVMELAAAADEAFIYDNTPPAPHEIAKKTGSEESIVVVNPEYFANIKLRENEIQSGPRRGGQQADQRRPGSGGNGEAERGGQSPDGSGESPEQSGRSGNRGSSLSSSPPPAYVRLTRGDKGNDPITPTTSQVEWAERNPQSAEKLRAIIDAQAKAKGYAPAKYLHGTPGKSPGLAKDAYAKNKHGLGLYEGTGEGDFTEFLREKTNDGMGLHFFTQSQMWAENFTGIEETNNRSEDGYRIIPAYLKIRNPWSVDNAEHRALIPELANERAELLTGGLGWMKIEKPEIVERIKSLGFDAIMMRERDPEGWFGDFETVAVFESSQAKDSSLVNFKDGKMIDPAARFDESKPSILYSSPAPELDLFGSFEEQLTGPRAKAKANAAEQIRNAPAKAKPQIAKSIAKREGLEDLDLFAAAAVRNLDAKPRRGETVINASGSGQLGFDFDSGTPAGQQADATRGARGNRADQATPGRANRSGEQASPPAGEGAASDVQGADSGRGGSGDGSASTDPRDGRGGRSEAGNRQGGGQDGGNSSPEAGKRKLVERERPAVGSPERNFTIGKDTVLAEGGTVTRLRNNLAAIDLLRTLEKEGRNATVEEKAVLAKYVGWGGIPQVFDEMMFRKVSSGEAEQRRTTANTYERYGPAYVKMVADYRDQADAIDKWNQKWGDHYRKLKELLSPEEWTSAQESTINAHYTSPKVITAMWDAVKRLGFLGGNILEPAGGVGHYFGLMPPSIAKRSQLFGVELDSISGRIFGKLYPEGQIEVTGFQDSTIPDNSQSLVISNVPFANINISDAYLDAQPDAPKFNLHNYFFEKALRVAQPGGLIAFITTSHTMDSQIAQRKWLAERADFLGAIRLPNNAFKENANTEVVTDIIFLRKPDGTPNPVSESWTATAEVPVDGGKVAINEYFARNPEMILGRLANDGSMYSGREEMTVHGNGDLAEQLREAIARLPENVVGDMESAVIERLSRENAAAKDGAFIEENGKLVIKGTGEVVEAKQAARVRSFITLRDTLNSLYLMESDPDATDADISRKRAELNRAYDTFRVVHKELHNPANKKVLSTDPDFYRTLGLETPQKSADGTKTTFTKADVFTKRILEPRVEPTSAENIEDAMIQSLRWKGRLDTKFVGKLMNLTRDQAETQLLSLPNVFRNPATGMLEQSTGYLAGNVRRKLRDAELAAQTNPDYNRNVEELRAVMPADVDWADIQYKIGSTWIPAEVYQDFIREKLMNGTGYPEVIYNKGVGEIIGDSFVVNSPAAYRHAIDEQWGVMTKGGAVDKSAFWVAEKVLNQEDPRINRTVDKKQVYDAEATETARAAAERMADAFIEWVDANPELQDRLHRIYNESFNSHVIPKYDGSFMQLPWVAKDFDLYPSKKHVVWRALQEGSMLVAHGVGGGKTIIGTAVAMEVRRLGLAKKPMIVVHNATLEQFATTISQMAPTARVLVARKEDLAGPKRKEFMGRIRSGDWDAVVMAHSTFDMIPDDPAWERQQINELLEELDDAIRDEGADPNETELRKIKEPSVKELVKMRKRLKDKISKLQDRKTDDVLTFQELGIDTVIVDEAHRYKKMPFVTRQSNIAGIDTGSSQRGTAMHLRSKWIQAQNGGRGVYTMTGTPVTNTLGESWNMIRLVRPDLLKEFAVQTFDRFVSVFGNIKQSGELRPNGQYKPVTRLAEFTNIPEWNRFWGLAADVKMGDDMDVKGRPKIKGGKPALTAVERTPQVAAVIAEITKVIDAYDKMTGKEKRENSHVPLLTYAAARMAAIDVRLVNPEAADDPGSKVNAAIANVMRIYKDTGDNKGTQVIFSDSYRPLKTTKLDLSAAEFEQKANDAGSETDSEEGFNLYHDIREKLVKAGVPRSEIAIIGEAKNDKQREIMFEKVNTGEIRIIMGSTETLGTGVNMQKRMFAAHHLDVPWTPAGLEQRDGRVFRQGNMWAGIGTGEIEIMRYGMKDTLDAALWQKLETKERMIKQAVSGEVNARVIEDDAGLLNYMEQKAALSGADGMLKFELDDAVRQFKNQFRTHRNRDYDLKKAMIRAQAQIDAAERNLPELRQAAELVAPLRDVDAQEVGWSIEGGEELKGEKARKALDEMFKARRKKAGAIANPETAPSLRESIRATANGVPVVFRVASISEDLANVANPDLRWQISWQAYFPGYESASSQASPHPGSNLSAVPALVRNIAAAPDSMERAAAQARKDIENFKSESGKPFPKLAEFRKTLIAQAELYDRMGISRPEGDDLYQNVLGERWQEKLKSGDKAARAETPANYPGAGLAPQNTTLMSSPAPEMDAPDIFTASRAPDAGKKLGGVTVGRMNALAAYRSITGKREKGIKLTAKEEQQLLDAEVALGQKLAFDMEALKTKTAPPDMRPVIERSTSGMDYLQMEMSRYGETDRAGQMSLLSSPVSFYSPLQRAVEAKIPARATPAQIMATVNAAGVKAEEVKWSGIEAALPNLAVDGKVPKDALLAYLRDEGAVRFEEVELEDQSAPPMTDEESQELYELTDKLDERGLTNLEQRRYDTLYSKSLARLKAQRPTKFGQYVLPGGDNYREIVLAMPSPTQEEFIKSRFTEEQWNAQTWEEKQAAFASYGAILSNRYTSTHFPDVPNYVAHMRLNEREDSTGKTGLFIEEIQSDRHQEGRKKGYDTDPVSELPSGYTLKSGGGNWWVENSAGEMVNPFKRPTREEAIGEAINGRSTAETYRDNTEKGSKGIADAPFRTTWPLAMFKRALRDAVEGGKTWIGWTVGETQNDRFDLSKTLSKLKVLVGPDEDLQSDQVALAGYGLDGSKVISETVKMDKLADYVGKDLAEKILAAGPGRQEYSGDGLKVGGSGMKGFYDNMLPKEIGKYVKQWGAKVEKSKLTDPDEMMTYEGLTEEGLTMREFNQLPREQAEALRIKHTTGTPIWRIDITPAMREGVPQGQALFSSPAPDPTPDEAAIQAALGSLPPIFRQVFEAINNGATQPEIAKRFNLTDRAVTNILNQATSRIRAAMKAADGELTPRMKDGKIDGGRPDLALGAKPAVAAIDQTRNQSGVPDVRGWGEVNAQADAMLREDYAGTYDALLAKARTLQPMTDVEVSAAKRIIAAETMAGRIQTTDERVKIAMMIHGYRDIGTETARALAIRRDPDMTPAQRHAQFIAEALFTPDAATRARLRKSDPKDAASILAGWMERVDRIKSELKARGIDLDASLAAYTERQEEMKQAAADSPATAAIIEESIRKLSRREKIVVEALRPGTTTYEGAAFLIGISKEEAKAIYMAWVTGIREAMKESAKRYLATTLASSPMDGMMAGILDELGIADPDMIAMDEADRPRVEREKAARKPRKPRKAKPAKDTEGKAPAPKVKPEPKVAKILGVPADKPLTAKQLEAIERFVNAPPSTWKAIRQETAALFPEIKGFPEKYWDGENARRILSRSLFPDPINETQGTFDLNDPIAMKEVINAFSIARATFGEKLMEYWRMSILTGPHTHIVNTGSNLMHAAYRQLPRKAVAAGVNNVLSLVGLGSKEQATFGEFAAMSRELRNGIGFAARTALRSWKTEERLFEEYASAAGRQLEFTGAGAETFAPALGGRLGKVMRSLSFRAMTTADEFIKSVTGHIEAAAQAHRIAREEEGLRGAAYEARVKQLMEPGSKAWLRAIDEAKTITFQTDIDGMNPQAIARLDQLAELAKKARSLPWIGKPLTFFIPFIDTPLNIFKEGIKMTPLGIALAVIDGTRALKRRVMKGDLSPQEAKVEAAKLYNRARLVDDVTNQTVAVALYFAIASLLGDDDDDLPAITGTTPYKSTRKGERDNAYAVMPEQSIRIGSVTFSYRRWEPFATALASMVDFVRKTEAHGGINAGSVSEWLAAHKDQVRDKTFLQGITSLMEAYDDPDRFATRLAANITTGFIPNIIRQPIRTADPMLRETRPRAEDGFFGTVARSVGYSVAPATAAPRVNVWGEEIRKNRGQVIGGSQVIDSALRILDPLNVTISPDIDPVDRWIYRYNYATADSADRIALLPIGGEITATPPGASRQVRIPLTIEEQTEANRRAGQAARSMIGEGWDETPLTTENAERIKRAVQDAQTQERARLRAEKLAAMTGGE